MPKIFTSSRLHLFNFIFNKCEKLLKYHNYPLNQKLNWNVDLNSWDHGNKQRGSQNISDRKKEVNDKCLQKIGGSNE